MRICSLAGHIPTRTAPLPLTMATRFRRRLSPQESPTRMGHLGGLASRFLVGVVVFASVELFRGDATFWPALITAAIVMGLVLGCSLWMRRLTRSDSGRFLLLPPQLSSPSPWGR